MEATQRLVRTWMASGRKQDVDAILSAINAKEATLIDLVKALGEYLTAEEDELRTKGVELLSTVIAQSPETSFNRQSVKTLTSFYISKLDDTETLVPALHGLLPLAQLSFFTSVEAIDVVKALFAHVKMRALVQPARHTVFRILDVLMARHRDTLKSLGSEFISGYLSLADGEKDPRNLMLAFALDRVLGIEFDITTHTEAFFDATACYFPITFRPPPDDPVGISPDDLRAALLAVLTSTPLLGPMVLPLFIDKLMAGSPASKRDTLSALTATAPIYGPAAVEKHCKKLWDYLRLEIFQPSDSETADAALKAVQALVRIMHTPTPSSSDEMTVDAPEGTKEQELLGLAGTITTECVGLLSHPEKSQAAHAASVLSGMLSTTLPVAQAVLSRTVPKLLTVLRDPDEAPNRAATLVHLGGLIDAARNPDLSVTKAGAHSEQDGLLLAPYKDDVLGALVSSLKTASGSSDTTPAALAGLQALVQTPDLLTDEEVGYIVHGATALFPTPTFASAEFTTSETTQLTDEATDALIKLLTVIATSTVPSHGRSVESQTLPALLALLPDAPPRRDEETARQVLWGALDTLRRLCSTTSLFDVLAVRLLAKVDVVLAGGAQEDPVEEREARVAYAHACLHTLAGLLETKLARKDSDVEKHVHKLVPRLFSLCVASALDKRSGGTQVAREPRLIEVVGRIGTLVLRGSSAAKQEQFLEILFPAFLDSKLDALLEVRQIPDTDVRFMPFEAGAPASQQALVPLFAAAVVSLRKETKLPAHDLKAFLRKVMWWGIEFASTDAGRNAANVIVASIVNKHTEELEPFLDSTVPAFWAERIASGTMFNYGHTRAHAINTWTTLSRALVIRNHSRGLTFAERLFSLFHDGDLEVVRTAAQAIGEVPSSSTVLSKPNGAVIRVLYAQKYAVAILPRLMEGAKVSADPGQQRPHLTALAALVKSIPYSVYADRMGALLPLLLRGLDLPESDIRASIIDTLYASATVGGSEQKIITEHASTLVSAMLKNCLVEHMPSHRVRIAALRYLGLIPTVVPYSTIHPQRALVLKELLKALDDPKKAVRKEAVDARSVWYVTSG